MSHRNLNRLLGGVVALGGLTICILWLLIGWYFVDNFILKEKTVDEAAPFTLPPVETIVAMSTEERGLLEATVMAQADAMTDTTMTDPMPDSPTLLATGNFAGVDAAHQGAGQANLYQLPDESYLVRFEAFSVTNGPDLHVILSRHPHPTTSAELLESHLDLGSLKGNKGNQNYKIQSYVDVSQFQSVVIYCQPFGVIFAQAPLE